MYNVNSPCRLGLAALLFSICLLLPNSALAQVSAAGSWRTVDIGAPAIAGKTTSFPCSSSWGCPFWSVTTGGTGIAALADQFTFVHQSLTGDGVINLHLFGFTGTASGQDGGVMIRESLDTAARHVSILGLTGGQVALRRRLTPGGTTTETKIAAPVAVGAYWLRLERVGQTITAWTSLDGATFRVVGSQTLALPATILVGVAVAGRRAGDKAAAWITDAMLSPKVPTLPAGWLSTKVGVVRRLGTSTYVNGVYSSAGSGAGVDSVRDGLEYIYSKVRGDVDFVARFTGAIGIAGRQAGIMVRSSLDPGSTQASLLVNDTGTWEYTRAAANGTTTKRALSTRTSAIWMKFERRAQIIALYTSADGANWTAVGSALAPSVTDFYVGVFSAAGTSGVTAGGTFDRVALSAVSANSPPSISITSPVSGLSLQILNSTTITAAAADLDDGVTSVDFFVNGAKIATDTVAPYSAAWHPGILGSYSLTAVARDATGATATSSPVSVLVILGIPIPIPDDTNSDGGGTYGPWKLEFQPSWDHASLLGYVLEIYLPFGGLVISQDLGKPPIGSNGRCTVDVDLLVGALSLGSYQAVVKAVDSTGSTPSAPSTFAR